MRTWMFPTSTPTAKRCSIARGRRASGHCLPLAMDLRSKSLGQRFLTPSSTTGSMRRWEFIRTRRSTRRMRTTRRLDRLARHPRVIAWGEIGLDYHYDHSPRDVQAQVFRRQLDQARAAKRPIIIHCREAWPDCLKILDEDWRSSGLGGIFHCFTGTVEEARSGMEMGFLVSFAGNVTYPKAQNLRDVAREIPLDRLLVETDSPFLAPQPHRGRRNEPAYVAEVARTIGNVRNLPADEVARATSENFRRLFRSRSIPARALAKFREERHLTSDGEGNF